MYEKDDNVSENFGFCEDEKSTPKIQDIKGDHRNLVSKSSDTKNCIKARCTLQNRLLGSESLLFLKEVRFTEQKFSAGTLISNIKYNYSKS